MKAISTLLLLLVATAATAQTIDVAVTVEPDRGRHAISPFIYGVNNGSNPDANLSARRQGGDRFTTYNWENNASNSGHWTYDPAQAHLNHTSDAMLTGYIPSDVPARVITDFHDVSLATGAYSLVTLQAGNVARDLHGPVSPAQAVPNHDRWREVVFSKGSAFSARPDTSDAFVYMDELVAYLTGRYGTASTATGIRGYGISNEPGAWSDVHPRSHPRKEGYGEIFSITRELATTIKAIDRDAEVFGGVTYGFSEMKDFQDAPDRAMFPGYRWYVDALLGEMKKASDEAGMRLMDVLDVHWYSEAEGDEPYRPVAWVENTPDIVEARLQATRSLWDRTYVEKSWITGRPGRYSHTEELFGDQAIALIPRLRESIATYDPGMKLAFGEFGFGGYEHVSGGIAVADALGIFGREGIYFASHWDAITGYVESAYRLFRNYDGARSSFGEISVDAVTSNDVASSAYASLSADGRRLHVVLLNRSMSAPVRASVAIGGTTAWGAGRVFGFDAGSTDVRPIGEVAADGNEVVWSLEPMSAVHIVLERAMSSAATEETLGVRSAGISATLLPNPCTTSTTLVLDLDRTQRVTVDLYDALGRHVASLGDGTLDVGRSSIAVDTEHLAAGRYVARVLTERGATSLPLTVVR